MITLASTGSGLAITSPWARGGGKGEGHSTIKPGGGRALKGKGFKDGDGEGGEGTTASGGVI